MMTAALRVRAVLRQGLQVLRAWKSAIPADDDPALLTLRTLQTLTAPYLAPDHVAEMWEGLRASRSDPALLVTFAFILHERGTTRRPEWRPLVTRIADESARLAAEDRDIEVRLLPDLMRALRPLRSSRLREGLPGAIAVFARLPAGLPLRRDFLQDLCIPFALQGRLKDLDPCCRSEHDWRPLATTRYADAVERGDLVAARRLLTEAEREAQRSVTGWETLLAYYRRLAHLIEASGRPGRVRPEPFGETTMAADIVAQAALLNADRVGIAAIAAREPLSASLSCALLPVFATLARGDLGTAEAFLNQRESQALHTASDDVAWAALHLLRGQPLGATPHVEAAVAAAVHYQALGRLEYDLRLVPGLTLGRLLVAATPGRKPYVPAGAPAAQLPDPGQGTLIGASPAMETVRAAIARAAASDLPVLIIGETGTGKELAARAIHRASARRQGPFVAVDCGTDADEPLLAELFGHARGAYTGASGERGGLLTEAAGGTVLLDGIGEASPRLQAALLRLLETGEYRRIGEEAVRTAACRLIATTAVDLAAATAAGRFRSDLRFRLERLVVSLPPLRARSEDIPLLLVHWLPGVAIAPELIDLLRTQPWPGNLRELRNACERIRVHSEAPARLDIEAWSTLNQPSASGRWTRAEIAGRSDPAPTPAAPEPRGPRPRGGDRRELVLRLFHERRRLTRQELMQHFDCAGSTATADLHDLLAQGLIEKVEPNKAPRSHYFRLREAAAAGG